MITKITDTNRDMYRALFKLAEDKLNLAEGSITTIDSYLTAMEQLGRHDPNNYDLLRLPHTNEEEPIFEIDANTREIKVPEVFKKNGLVVKGDHLSEIIWFKINRYFDMMDFYLFANDGINDGAPNAHQGMHCYIEWFNPAAQDEEHQRGVDFAYAMTCDEDFVYFGWPLGNKLSGESGTLQFAVRFLSITDNATQNADGSTNRIDFNYSTKTATCDIKATLDFNMLDGSIAAESWEDILYTRPIYSHVINSVSSPAPVLLLGLDTKEVDLDEDGKYTMDVIATTSMGAPAGTTQTLKFTWYKDGMVVQGLADGITKGVAPDEDYAAIVLGNAAAKQSSYDATGVGSYTVYISNVLTKDGKSQQTRTIYTGTIVVPDPTAIVAIYSGILDRAYVGNELKCEIENLEDHELVNGTVGYQWYKKTDMAHDDWTAISGATQSTYTPTDEGIYCCIVSNTKNLKTVYNTGNTANPRDTEVVKYADIRQFPQRPTSLNLSFSWANQQLTATATHAYPNHNIQYHWMYVSPDLTTTKEVKYDVPEGITTSTFTPHDPGKYYVVASEITFYQDDTYQKIGEVDKSYTSVPIILSVDPDNNTKLVIDASSPANGGSGD